MWPFSALSKAVKAIDVADKFVDGAMSGIDKLFYTDEEKADSRKEAAKMYLAHQKLILGENTARSITRRYLAVMIIGVFLSGLIFAVGIWKYSQEWAKFTLEVTGNLATGFGMILVCYFGYYAAGNLMDKRKK